MLFNVIFRKIYFKDSRYSRETKTVSKTIETIFSQKITTTCEKYPTLFRTAEVSVNFLRTF